jgi:hypothetical protein
MTGLVATTFLLLVLAATNVVSWWWQAVADLAVVAFVAHLRAEAKRTTAIARRRQQLRARRTQAAVPVPAQARPAGPAYDAVDVPMPAVVVSSEAVGSGPLIVDEETWQPVPVPLPTYVTAPVAERPEPMTIDLTRPGAWSDAQEREPLFDQEAFDDEVTSVVDEDELAEIVQRRRAVND